MMALLLKLLRGRAKYSYLGNRCCLASTPLTNRTDGERETETEIERKGGGEEREGTIPFSTDLPPPPAIPVLPCMPFSRGGAEPEPEEVGGRNPLGVWPGSTHSPATNALWQARSAISERPWLHSDLPGLDPSLITRTPKESRVAIVYSFAEDGVLREHYRNAWNQCRVGKIMEDLDALAGTIAMKHCSDDDNTTRPLLLVTASVDKITLSRPIILDANMKMYGAVTWVGKSSMEIRMEIKQPAGGSSEGSDPVALSANFTFVARDWKTGKAALVNRLDPQTEEEKRLFQEAENRNDRRKKQRQKTQSNATNGHKSHLDNTKLQALLAEGRVLCDMPSLADRNSILMKETRLETAHICQPQQRNMHGRIFGGYLMHRAFELAFSTCYIFVGHKPVFLEVDRIDFLRPVDVGDFVRFRSCVLYTETENTRNPLINIKVAAFVTRPELRTSEVSNTFFFTFSLPTEAMENGSVNVRKVLPETEEEARQILLRYEANHEDGQL